MCPSCHRWSTPWIGRQSVAGVAQKYRQPFTVRFDLFRFRFANIPVISVDCGRKMEYLVKTHASMQKTQTLHEQHRAAIRPVTCCKKVQGSDSEELCEYSNEML